MSKLSDLEIRSIKDIQLSLMNISKSYNDNQDSVQDFICGQFKIKTDEPETLKQVKAHFETMIGNIEDVQAEFKLLSEHLTQK